MSNKNHASASSVSMTLFFSIILFACDADASHTSPYCITAIDKHFCEKVVNGAKTWGEAMIRAMKKTQHQVDRMEPLVIRLIKELPSSLSPATKLSIYHTCKESYKSLAEEMKESMEAVKEGTHTENLNYWLSGAATDVADCSRAIKEFIKIPHKIKLYKTSELTAKLISTCLAVDNSLPDGDAPEKQH